jgi:hypothetical protein
MADTRKYKVRSVIDVVWQNTPKVTGIVSEPAKAVKELKGRRVLTIEGEGRTYRVFENYNLEDVFKQARKGDHVDIEYLGTVPTKKKGHTVHKFDARLWTE